MISIEKKKFGQLKKQWEELEARKEKILPFQMDVSIWKRAPISEDKAFAPTEKAKVFHGRIPAKGGCNANRHERTII